jgi:hypothetical protein
LSRSVDLFIDSAEALPDIASEIARTVGVEASECPDDGEWIIAFDATEARLGGHPYLDDGVFPFSRYRYCLSARVSDPSPPDEPPRASRHPSASEWESVAGQFRLVAARLRAAGGFSCLVVIDLEFRDPMDALDDRGDGR